MTEQINSQSQNQPAASAAPELTPATLGILVELANGCAEDRANWGAPGSNDRHGTRYYLELISRQVRPLTVQDLDDTQQRGRLLQIARHAIEAVEALDVRRRGGVN
jgi:hypothetical protein